MTTMYSINWHPLLIWQQCKCLKRHQCQCLCDERLIHYLTGSLRQAVVFGDICATTPPPTSPSAFVSLDFLLSRERLAGACVCVCMCVWKSLGVFYDLMRVLWWGTKNPQSTARSGTLKHWDFKCVWVWDNVKVLSKWGWILKTLQIWTDSCKKRKLQTCLSLLLIYWILYFSSYPQI